MEYRIAFGYTVPVYIFLINDTSRMDSHSSFVDISRRVKIVRLNTHVQVGLANRWWQMAEGEF